MRTRSVAVFSHSKKNLNFKKTVRNYSSQFIVLKGQFNSTQRQRLGNYMIKDKSICFLKQYNEPKHF